jgi:hypothetical protein
LPLGVSKVDRRSTESPVGWSLAAQTPSRCLRSSRSCGRPAARFADADVLGVDVAEETSEPRDVLGGWIRNDVEILRGAHEPMYAHGDSTDDDEVDLRVRQREKQIIGLEHCRGRPASAR